MLFQLTNFTVKCEVDFFLEIQRFAVFLAQKTKIKITAL